MISNFDRFCALQMVSIFLYRFLRTKLSLGNLTMRKFWCESKFAVLIARIGTQFSWFGTYANRVIYKYDNANNVNTVTCHKNYHWMSIKFKILYRRSRRRFGDFVWRLSWKLYSVRNEVSLIWYFKTYVFTIIFSIEYNWYETRIN